MRYLALFLAMAVCLALFGAAMSAGVVDIGWWSVAGGGGHAAAGPYSLDGTAGQAVAGTVSGGGRSVCAGFLCGDQPAARHSVFLPVVVRP